MTLPVLSFVPSALPEHRMDRGHNNLLSSMVLEVLTPEQLVAKSIAPVKREFWRADQDSHPAAARDEQSAPAKSKRKQKQVNLTHVAATPKLDLILWQLDPVWCSTRQNMVPSCASSLQVCKCTCNSAPYLCYPMSLTRGFRLASP